MSYYYTDHAISDRDLARIASELKTKDLLKMRLVSKRHLHFANEELILRARDLNDDDVPYEAIPLDGNYQTLLRNLYVEDKTPEFERSMTMLTVQSHRALNLLGYLAGKPPNLDYLSTFLVILMTFINPTEDVLTRVAKWIEEINHPTLRFGIVISGDSRSTFNNLSMFENTMLHYVGLEDCPNLTDVSALNGTYSVALQKCLNVKNVTSLGDVYSLKIEDMPDVDKTKLRNTKIY